MFYDIKAVMPHIKQYQQFVREGGLDEVLANVYPQKGTILIFFLFIKVYFTLYERLGDNNNG